MQLNEPAITRRIKGWTKGWEKERHKRMMLYTRQFL